MSSKTKVRLFVGVAVVMLSTTVMAQQAKTASDPASATIGDITALQRKVVMAELNKKLRDANAVDKGSAGGSASTFPSASVPGGAIVALPSPRKKVAPTDDVRVVAISGMGAALQATLNNGQTVKSGQKFSANDDAWEVVRVNAVSVQFKRCSPENKKKKDKGGCKDITLAVSP